MEKETYIFPCIFIYKESGGIGIYFPDLDGCRTYDDTIEGASLMAKDALIEQLKLG